MDIHRDITPRLNELMGLEYVGLLLIAVGLFGAEWRHGAMDRLLSQPIARGRLFSEKIMAYGLVYLTIFLIHVVFFAALFRYFHHFTLPGLLIRRIIDVTSIRFALPSARIHLGLGVLALANGLLASLLIRQVHTAFWAALTFPVAIALLLMTYAPPALGQPVWVSLPAPACLWVVVAFPLAWLKFKRLEV